MTSEKPRRRWPFGWLSDITLMIALAACLALQIPGYGKFVEASQVQLWITIAAVNFALALTFYVCWLRQAHGRRWLRQLGVSFILYGVLAAGTYLSMTLPSQENVPGLILGLELTWISAAAVILLWGLYIRRHNGGST